MKDIYSISSILLLVLAAFSHTVESFNVRSVAPSKPFVRMGKRPLVSKSSAIFASSDTDEKKPLGVIELDDEPNGLKQPSKQSAPFFSQGDISPEALNPDFSDPKQTRVIIYVIISLLPVLFLIPLMLGSRDLIPLDALPPVQM
jgi:hypothetical protein